MQMVMVWRIIIGFVAGFAVVVALNVNHRLLPMESDMRILKAELKGSRGALKRLEAGIDRLGKAIKEELARVQAEVAARPVINIKYGTVLNTDGEVLVEKTNGKEKKRK